MDLNSLDIISPKLDDWGIPIGKPHYLIKWDLYVIVDGLNMKYEARYPASRKDAGGNVIEHRDHSFRLDGQVSIAAAFKPGV